MVALRQYWSQYHIRHLTMSMINSGRRFVEGNRREQYSLVRLSAWLPRFDIVSKERKWINSLSISRIHLIDFCRKSNVMLSHRRSLDKNNSQIVTHFRTCVLHNTNGPPLETNTASIIIPFTTDSISTKVGSHWVAISSEFNMDWVEPTSLHMRNAINFGIWW